ncbi:dehydration-responsive element-binding protein 1C-like [Phragmites australis]|uniref:dehydration-responsive element-binding protein 1C-like n=1 Tax=Phragmites australis TaxID=29695 RepID=UPI002D78084E|nr:dehydration-responsive element-binding protein 1C-like [Phragmites australis]
MTDSATATSRCSRSPAPIVWFLLLLMPTTRDDADSARLLRVDPATLATPEDIRRAAIELAEASGAHDAAAAAASSSSAVDAAPPTMAHQEEPAPYDYSMYYGNMDFDQPYYYDGVGGGGGGDWQNSWHMDGDDDGGGSDMTLWSY